MIKLHRCGSLWAKMGSHPCWKVQKALDEQGIEYEIVTGPWPSRKKRTAVIGGTGQAVAVAHLHDAFEEQDRCLVRLVVVRP